MQPPAAKKPVGPKDYVGEALGSVERGEAQFETPEDLLLRALEMMTEDESGERLLGHRRKLRGEPEPMPEGEELPAQEGTLPPECEAGECDHPEHQLEDSLPSDHDFEG